jgi:beta-glucosidase
MKKILKRTSLLLISALMSIAAAQAQKSPQDMDRFIDALMKKMTVEEKIGQLNLPVTGDITTGQAKSSDVAQKIEKGLVGGLFNLKGVDRILEVQKLAVEKSRLGIPLLFGMDVIHGYETIFPIPLDCPAPGIWRLSRNPPVLQPSKQVPTAFAGHSVRW